MPDRQIDKQPLALLDTDSQPREAQQIADQQMEQLAVFESFKSCLAHIKPGGFYCSLRRGITESSLGNLC